MKHLLKMEEQKKEKEAKQKRDVDRKERIRNIGRRNYEAYKMQLQEQLVVGCSALPNKHVVVYNSAE